MRIGLIIYGSIETLTGGYLYDKYLVQHLESQGDTVDIILLPWRNYWCHIGDNMSKKLLNRLLRTPFDVLLQDELNHPSLFWLNRILREQVKYPIVTIVHQVLCRQPRNILQNMVYRAIEARFLASVDAYIFNSKTTQETVAQVISNDRPSIIAYPGGDRLGHIDSIETIRRRAYERGPLRLLFIGNVLPHKGVYELIEALSRIPKEKWRLSIVGSLAMDTEYVRRIERLLHQKRLLFEESAQPFHDASTQVRLTGPLIGDDLVKHLSHNQLFVMPFSHEGFGIVYLEGMAYGLPAIGSTEGAVKEIVRHGENGFLVAPNLQEVLRQHIETLYGDRERLAKMGIAALNTFHAHPTWHASMESIHGFLMNLTY